MGCWDDFFWYWNFRWRRFFLIWEEEQKIEMMNIIEGISLGRNMVDLFHWKYGRYGEFLVKSFVREILISNDE